MGNVLNQQKQNRGGLTMKRTQNEGILQIKNSLLLAQSNQAPGRVLKLLRWSVVLDSF